MRLNRRYVSVRGGRDVPLNTLLEIFDAAKSLGNQEAVRHADGLRTRIWSYRELVSQAARFAAYLDGEGFSRGERLVVWSENRPEWIAAFWGCLARGVTLVPVDIHSTPERVIRIRDESGSRSIVHGARPLPQSGSVFPLSDLATLPAPKEFRPDPADPSEIVELLYTSGTTADPKGVVHRHRNICSNLTPIAEEIARYRRWARPFQPIRFLQTVPLSHMFGQSMGLFIPPVLGGAVVFMNELHPGSIRETIRRERVSVLVSVPRILEAISADVERRHPETRPATLTSKGVLGRWWRHRHIHGEFGWKFWAAVVGGAPLAQDIEAFWASRGWLVIQGYGLTETSPVVSVNHPFHARRGSLGKPVGDQEVRLASDGEILVRGSSVSGEYLAAGGRFERTTDDEGWFHTGDLGEMDADGRLTYRGRKKDVIVTADGLNIHPEDIERVFNAQPGIRDSAVVAVSNPSGDRAHAALILDDAETEPAILVEAANRNLEPEQRIGLWSVWPDPEFPRTESTHKLQRRLVAAAVAGNRTGPVPEGPPGVEEILARLTGNPALAATPEKRLAEDLALTSLDRVDLLGEMERRYGIDIDEMEFAAVETVGELRRFAEPRAARPAPGIGSPTPDTGSPGLSQRAASPARTPRPPRWSRTMPARTARRILQGALIRPLLRVFAGIDVEGAGHLDRVPAPALFAANHTSHLDVPAIASALPDPWRRWLAPAMRQEYFFPAGDRSSPILYFLACLAFNAYPLPQNPGRVRDSLRYTGELLSDGYFPLIFPEGRRSEDGALGPFQPGIGLMAVRLGVPVVPLRVEGLFEMLPVGRRWPRLGRARLKIGKPLQAGEGEDYRSFTARVEAAIRGLESHG